MAGSYSAVLATASLDNVDCETTPDRVRRLWSDCRRSQLSKAPRSRHLSAPIAAGLLRQSIRNFWLITRDDFPTFVLPNTIFGICTGIAIACSRPPECSDSTADVLRRTPLIIIFNWANLFVFDLANQRTPESAAEDKLNKPWRPVPAGLLTCDQMRQMMHFAIPVVLLLDALVLGAVSETAVLFILAWLYNDLKAGEHWLMRNIILAFTFGFCNIGSLKVAMSKDYDISGKEIWWIVIISGVILTTMHVQDLKDVAGDKLRNRQTLPVLFGVPVARRSLAAPIVVWTLVCAYYWSLRWAAIGPVALAAYLVFRCLRGGDKRSDRVTWQLWCFWTAVLYTMPLLPVGLGGV